MSHLIPEVHVNKNGVSVIKYVRPESAGSPIKKAIPAPVTKTTLAGTISELGDLGIHLRNHTYGIKFLARSSPETLEKIMDAIRKADAPTREVWLQTLGDHGDATNYQQLLPYSRMLANNELTAQLVNAIGPEVLQNARLFRTDDLAADIEEETDIRPGDPRYNEVQAAVIYCAITEPLLVSRSRYSFEFLEENRDEIMVIANNMDRVRESLPELCRGRDASRHAILGLARSEAQVLDGGVL